MSKHLNKHILIALMENAITEEQSYKHREKLLTPGLAAAMKIIREYKLTSADEFEYSNDGLTWSPVKNNANILTLIDNGMAVRRKK